MAIFRTPIKSDGDKDSADATNLADSDFNWRLDSLGYF